MRVKEPSKALAEKAKRSKRPTIPHDEDSSDDIAVGFTCQHVSHAVSVNHVKRAITETLWSVCSECLKERRFYDGQPVLSSDIWLCLKCGFQGCGKNSESQHSLKHFKSWKTEPHCIVISLSTWIIWCYECDEKLSTHCNKKVLVQIVDFLQKHISKTQTSAVSRIIKLCEEKCEIGEKKKGKKGSSVTSVKGITNLGNTCFFNAVLQNLAQSYILTELINEIKENGTKFKIFPSDCQLDPLVVELSSPGPLTSSLFLFLQSMKETEKGPLSPKVLFNQLCQKAPGFKSLQQQDSQELLHYLLDAVRTEETKRIQASILKAFNNPTTKTADDETKKKVKAYGREGVKMNFIDRIFIGELTSTVMCEECANISMVKDPFIDISLPIIEERVSKPVLLGKMSKYRSSQETDNGQYNGTVAIENTHQPRAIQKHFSSKNKNQLIHGRKSIKKLSSGEDKTVVIYRKNEDPEMNGDSSVFVSIRSAETTLTESPTDGSEKEASHSESSADADSEASESESASNNSVLLRCSNGCCVHTNGHLPHPSASQLHIKKNDSGDEGVAEAISELHLSNAEMGDRNFDRENQPLSVPNNFCFSEEKHMVSHSPQNAFQTLSQSYVTTSKECSIQSCLYQFTSMELLMGNNKLLCENCTEKKQKYQKETSSAERKAEGVYTNARKQLLISAVPAILILHLKRFHQAGLSLRKVNRHVDFPLLLDLAPFCSATCKNVSVGDKVLYGLYGIVEHSGSMRGGHYTAYVKVRTPSRKLLEHITGKKSVPGLKEPDGDAADQWVHVSDTYVQVVPESRALSAQAYLLFYERIL
ncbi:ubiquitin carboxyl-terminal hydrolase 45 isoform X1 [Talpa occidentalis]|uniref:ubiquitin carboxyl-terminal hydrolase 45 isoform X1 n=3 Tax=Talpa occidentalis TaxID=50954 RepID=UPI00188F06B2|nr:ubiquitin carboxyl-terminal hydrolase 45 isoform X1 [Talpa occidentalis]